MKRLTTLIFITIFSVPFLVAQSVNDTTQTPYWIDMMADPSVNFYQTQRAFNLYWQNRTIEKGSGYKPFKRWEHSTAELIDANGNIPSPGALDFEVEKYLKQRSLNKKTNTGALGGSAATCQTTGNWVELGPTSLPSNRTGQPNGLGRINAVAFHPTDSSIIYVGAPAGGLWVTKDGGQTWSTNTDSLSSLGISSIAVDPSRPDTIYLGTGDRDAGDSYGRGIYKSTDGGQTWVLSNSGMGNKIVGKLLIDPSNNNTLIAATNGGIYRSTNGGSSWALEQSGNFKDLVFDAVNSSILFACRTSARLYKSTDNGQSWSQITSGLPSSKSRMAVAVTPDDSNFVYVVVTNSRTYEGLYLSTNRGSSFTQMSDTPNIMDYSHLGTGTGGQAWYDLDIAVDPSDKSVVNVCGVNIFQSLDSGKTWKINAHWVGSGGAPKVHADNHVLEYQPGTNTLYSGNDGGVYYTKNLGSSWVDVSDGLAIAQIYRLGQSATEFNTIINGYQDNGTGLYEKGKWYTVVGGDGMDCVIDPTTATYAYSALYYGDIRRIKDGRSQGTIAKSGVNGISESGAWVTPYVLREGTPSTMFVGYKNIWRSTSIKASSRTSVSWTKISNNVAGSNSSNIAAIENSSANPDILYVARSDKKFFKSTNVNATSPSWTDLTSSLPVNTTPLWIESHPTYTNRVWICLNNKIYQSNNGGSSWSNISNGLPNIPILCVVFDSSSKKQGMYLGTYMGVYYKDTTMTSWSWFNDNMPINTRVRDIEIYHSPSGRSLSHVVCATYGRGNWKSTLYDEDQIKPIAGFAANNSVLCSGETVQFTDTSTYTPTAWLWRVSPKTISFMNGTDSCSQNPQIRFDSVGSYSVQLFAENCSGIDSILKSSNIKVPPKVTAAKCSTTTTNKSVNYGIGIFEVSLNGYTFSSAGLYDEGEYVDQTCTEILRLQADTFYLTTIKTGNSNDEYVKVYIDFNNNGDLSDTGELVFDTKNRTTHSDTIKIPKSVVKDTFLRMRVLSDFSRISSSCGTLRYGQTEDRSIFFENTSSTATVFDTACTSYTWTLNSTTYTSSGSYTHTLKGKNAAGGDSIVTLHLLINDASFATVADTACNTYTWSQNSTTYTSSGAYKDTMVAANAVGCDSIITLNLTVNTSNTGIDTIVECDSYKWIDGKTYTSSNSTATYTVTNASGCDSVVSLNLIINKSSKGTDTLVACDSYRWIDGKTYTSNNNTATHKVTNSVGCDSTVTLNLTIYKTTTSSSSDTACDSYKWSQNSKTYTSTGTYRDTMNSANANGCDSIITLNLVVNKSSNSTDNQTACDAYKWIDGKTYTSSNTTATYTLTNATGCDSVVTLNLTINKSNTGTDVQTACDSYRWIDGTTYTASNNTATHTVKNTSGCDSVVTLNLTLNTKSFATVNDTACDAYTWAINGKTYNSSGRYVDTLAGKNSVGCDSIITLNLVITNSNTGTDVQSACDTYKWIDGKTYTVSNNTATHTLVNAAGCDSVVTLNLTILRYSTATDVQTACNTFTWIDGKTYTKSNTTATHTLKNAVGCDSIVTLNLTVNYANSGTDIQTACDSYNWIDGNNYTSSNSRAQHTVQNASGCDSLVTLNLTMSYSSTGVDKQTSCDTYTWIDGKTYTVSNNTATHTLTNASGCDSVVTLNLTINRYSTGVDKQTACGPFTWIDGKTYTTSNMTATHTLKNAAGCDSIVTLNLTMYAPTAGIDRQIACDELTWIDGKTYTSSTNTPTFTLTNANGCDSVVTLNLTIITIDVTVKTNDPQMTVNESGVTYQWLDCKNNYAEISGATSQTFIASRNGIYAVEVRYGNCVDTSDCVTISLASVFDNVFFDKVKVYPNPNNGVVNVYMADLKNVSIAVYDLNGKVVYNQNSINQPEYQFELDVAKGVYILELNTEGKTHQVKLVKR